MFKNRRKVRIEWGDCDAAGIVFYPRYFAMFDASTHYLYEAAGFTKHVMIAKFGILGTPMVDTRAQFFIPSSFGDDIEIESCVTEFKRSSFFISHKAFKGDKLAIEATEVRVWAGKDPETGIIKSRAIPQEFIERFQKI